jgi:hypothetical protein
MNSRHFVHKIILLIPFNIQFYYHHKTLEQKNEKYEEEKICDWGISSLGVRKKNNFAISLFKEMKSFLEQTFFPSSSLPFFKRSLSAVWGKVLRFSL